MECITSFWRKLYIYNYEDNPQMEGKYTEWPNPQIRGENRQSGLTD